MDRPYLGGVSMSGMRRLAAEILPDDAYAYFETGAGDEFTMRANDVAWAHWAFAPLVLTGERELTTRTTVLGHEVGAPVVVAPMAAHSLAHPDGEFATVRAAAALEQIVVVSVNATASIEALGAIPGSRLWLQLYAARERERTLALATRAQAAGVTALVLTVDSVLETPERRRPHGDGTLPPGLVFPMNDGAPLADGLDWAAVEWLAGHIDVPLVLKGIMRPDDARRAVDSGCAAIVVSNHGGRQVDGTLATAEVVGEIAGAVGDTIEVYVDGGIRRGADVLRALALGARAVLVGRPVLWGLAAAGEPGVTRVLDLLRAELYAAAREVGVAALDRVPADLVRASTVIAAGLPPAEMVRGR